MTKPSAEVKELVSVCNSAELYELIAATNKAKPAAKDITRLRQYLFKHPVAVDLIGNLATQIEGQILTTDGFFSGLLATAAGEYCEKMRVKLGYADAGMLEKGLIDHLVICWLRMQTCELQYERYTKGATLTVATFWENTLSATQKRYLRSVEALAKIRRLGVSVQINIADKQIVTG